MHRVADEVIAPNAAGTTATATFPQASVDAINALGLNALFVPEAYGGSSGRATRCISRW